MEKGKSFTGIVLFALFVLPMLIYFFFYFGTEQRFQRVPYQYDIVENGDTVFHELPIFALVNLDGDTLRKEDLLGNITLIDFFTTVDDSFKLTTVLHGNLTRTFKNINWEQNPSIRYLSINTGDPIDEVQAYANQREDIDPERWWITTGSPEEIEKLASQTFNLPEFARRIPSDPPITSQTVALVDKTGKVRKYYIATDLVQERKIAEDLIALFRMEYQEELGK